METKEIKRRGTRGITLIALVVTIVVLLILAGTAIAMLTGDDGIIKNAQLGKEDNDKGREKEIVTLAVGSALSEEEGYEIKREHLNTALANHIGTEGEDYILSETEPYIVKYLESGRSYIIDEKGKVSEYEEIDLTGVEVGQYVAYNPTVKDLSGTPVDESLTYISPKGDGKNHGNGNAPQTFTATANTKWRILSIENGTVTLISENGISCDDRTALWLYGPTGYSYAEQELHEICKIYGYGYGADINQVTGYSYGGPLDGNLTGQITGSGSRSITIEDINKYAGIEEDENGIIRFSDGAMVDSNYGSTINLTKGIYYPTITTEDGVSASAGMKEIRHTFYSYSVNRFCVQARDLLYDGTSYLVASRCTDASYWGAWGVRIIDKWTEGVEMYQICSGNPAGFNYVGRITYRVRPLVSLKSEVIDIEAGYNEATGGWKLK